MNRKILKSRYIQVIFFVVILMLILCVRLFVLTVVQEEKWAEAAKNQNTKEVLLSAPRGKIYDRYGRVLAGNKQIFTVTFNASGLSTEQINASAYRTIRLLEKNGDTYVDNFPIKITKSGKFYYTYDSSKKKWLKSLGLSKNATAEQAFEKLRAKYEIDPTLDRFDAMDELQNTHGVWPPINVRSMTFTYDTKKAAFISKYGLEVKETDAEGNVTKRTDLTAKEAFQALRKNINWMKMRINNRFRKRNGFPIKKRARFLWSEKKSKISNSTNIVPAPSPPMSATRQSPISRKWAVSSRGWRSPQRRFASTRTKIWLPIFSALWAVFPTASMIPMSRNAATAAMI